MEEKKPWQFQKGNPGKPKGAVSHLTKTVKETVLEVFNQLQADPAHDLASFAKKNPRDFYAIAAKLIPTELKASVEMEQVILNITKAPIDGTDTGERLPDQNSH